MAATGLRSDARGATQDRAGRCGACRFFIGEPAALERAIAGLNILSSAYGSACGDTGLCERHDRFVTSATPACPQFVKE